METANVWYGIQYALGMRSVRTTAAPGHVTQSTTSIQIGQSKTNIYK